MGRKERARRAARSQGKGPDAASLWVADDGVHALVPGPQPSSGLLERLSHRFRENLRGSPLWDEMVKELGKERAEELLQQCRAESRR